MVTVDDARAKGARSNASKDGTKSTNTKNSTNAKNNASKTVGVEKQKNGAKSSRRMSSQATPTPRSSATLWLIVAIALLGIAFAVALVWLFWPTSPSSVLVSVNAEPITVADFNFQYQLLPDTYKATFTKDQVLEQIIDEELVVQASKRAGTVVTQQDIHERVQQVLTSSGTSLQDFEKNLEGYNVTQEQFEKLVERQIYIERYLKDKLQPIAIDDATAKAAYDAQKQLYIIPEQVTVRHILFSIQRPDAAKLAKAAYDAIQQGANFCAIAANSSDDRGSRETCGQYTFGRGFMVKEFEQSSFDMAPRELRMVQTQFGYHVIQKINTTPSSIQPFEAVKDKIVADLQSAARAQQYRVIINDLRAHAVIKYANGTIVLPQQGASIAPAGDATPTLAPANAPANDVAPSPREQQPAATANVVVDTTPAPTPANAPAPTTAPTTAPANNVQAPTPQQAAPPSVAPSSFTCIANRAKLYGTSWSSDTAAALDLFSREGVSLQYVECDGAGKDQCAAASIKAYPTWVVGAKQYMGFMTLAQLQQATGC